VEDYILLQNLHWSLEEKLVERLKPLARG